MSLDRTVKTPAGFEIEFIGSPKKPSGKPRHEYFIEGEEVPSWTTVLNILDKPGLPWWAMKIGVEGVCELLRGSGIDEIEADLDRAALDIHHADDHWYEYPQAVVDKLTEHKLTVNHIRDKAADRGTDVHVAAAKWAQTGVMPNPLDYPEEQRGYVKALEAWLTLADPEPLGAEEIVGSPMLGVAGTLDLRTRLGERAGIVDYKTTTSIRNPSHDYQLTGYELMSQESGYDPTDFQAVLLLKPDGTFEWYETQAKPHIVQHLVAIWYENKRINEALKAARKEAKRLASLG